MVRVGHRIWKTGLAVAAGMLIARQTPHLYEVYVALAAAVSVAPTAGRSLRAMGSQLAVNLLGGLIGGIVVYVMGSNPLAMAVGLVLALATAQRLGWSDRQTSVITATIFVMAPHTDQIQTYVLQRWLSVMLGCAVGTAVNAWVLPPNYWPKALCELAKSGSELDSFIGLVREKLSSPKTLSKAEVLGEVARVEKQIEEALAGLSELRASIYGRLFTGFGARDAAADLLEMEDRFKTTAMPPEGLHVVDHFFELHRMRSSVSYMANRLRHLQIAADQALPDLPLQEMRQADQVQA